MKNHWQYKRNLSLFAKIIKNSIRNCSTLICEIKRLVQIYCEFFRLIFARTPVLNVVVKILKKIKNCLYRF